MIKVVEATYEGGVFKPDGRLDLLENSRVRLLVEALSEDADESDGARSWATLERLWQESTFDSQGGRLSRDQLHERR